MESLHPNNIPTRYNKATILIPNGVIYPTGMSRSNRGMDITEIRLANLRALAGLAGGRPQLAKRLDMSYQLLQNYIGKTPTKRIGDKTARHAEEIFGLAHGWMDKLQAKDGEVVEASPTPWPFKIEWSRFDRLPKSEKARIGRFVKDTIETWEAEQEPEIKKVG